MAKVDGAKDGPTHVIPPADMDVGAELHDIYHRAVIATKGDINAAKQAKAQATPKIEQFAHLLKVARNADNKTSAARALSQAREILGDGAASLDSWIHHHVDPAVITAAGLDPTDMAKAAGVIKEKEPDVEQAGRNLREFRGDRNDRNEVPNKNAGGGDGSTVADFGQPRRI